MKNKYVGFVLSSIAALSFNGCGSSGDSVTGIYDIKDYFAPSVNDTHVIETYSSTSSDITSATYDDTDRYQYTKIEDDTFTLNISYGDGDESLYNISIDSSKYLITYEEEQKTYKYTFPRKVDVGDTFTFSDNVIEYDTLTDKDKTTCVVDEHIETKTFSINNINQSFNNVLKITCTINSEVVGKIDAVREYSEVDIYTTYYAKGIGEVYMYDKDCNDANSDTQDNLTQCPGGEKYSWKIIKSYTATPAE